MAWLNPDAADDELTQMAARLVVEEGMEYGPAKRRAARELGLGKRAALPDNDALEAAVADYIALFCGDTQPGELRALRALALVWMERLERFRPHLTGAVWAGTATRHSDIHLHLYCDDVKEAELALIDQRVEYDTGEHQGPNGAPIPVLMVAVRCPELGAMVGVHLVVMDHDDLRGALQPDRKGRTPRGDIHAVRRLVHHRAHD